MSIFPITLNLLQEESHVSLNTVDSVDTFTSDILNGNWDSVVRAVSRVSLPADKMIFLYDQVSQLNYGTPTELWISRLRPSGSIRPKGVHNHLTTKH